jgi:hypothetical protein
LGETLKTLFWDFPPLGETFKTLFWDFPPLGETLKTLFWDFPPRGEALRKPARAMLRWRSIFSARFCERKIFSIDLADLFFIFFFLLLSPPLFLSDACRLINRLV